MAQRQAPSLLRAQGTARTGTPFVAADASTEATRRVFWRCQVKDFPLSLSHGVSATAPTFMRVRLVTYVGKQPLHEHGMSIQQFPGAFCDAALQCPDRSFDLIVALLGRAVVAPFSLGRLLCHRVLIALTSHGLDRFHDCSRCLVLHHSS